MILASMRLWQTALFLAAMSVACEDRIPRPPSLARPTLARRTLRLGEHFPDTAETAAAGPIETRILAAAARSRLVRCDDPNIVFKNEERSGADQLMTRRLRSRLISLAGRVSREWPELRLRLTEAWDAEGEHSPASLHYEARAADITLSDRDPKKLGRLAKLAVESGFDWVYFEDAGHVHVSVRRD